MPGGRTSRRDFIRSGGAGFALLLAAPPLAFAAPLSVNLSTTKRSNDVRVRVRMSVDLGPFHLNDHLVGTFYVPYTGTKTFNGNIMAGLFYVFKMSIENQKKDLKFIAEVSAGVHKATMSIIKNLN